MERWSGSKPRTGGNVREEEGGVGQRKAVEGGGGGKKKWVMAVVLSPFPACGDDGSG